MNDFVLTVVVALPSLHLKFPNISVFFRRYSRDIVTPHRHVRTRLYFTSESHIHTMINAIRYGNLCDVSLARYIIQHVVPTGTINFVLLAWIKEYFNVEIVHSANFSRSHSSLQVKRIDFQNH